MKYYQDQRTGITPKRRHYFGFRTNMCNTVSIHRMIVTRSESEHDDPFIAVLEEPTPEIDVAAKEELFDLLGRAHVVPILHEFASDAGPRRFTDVRDQLEIPPTTLTDRLQELTDAGFITRQSYDEIPPRVEYTATEKTIDLTPMFEYLCQWAVYHQ